MSSQNPQQPGWASAEVSVVTLPDGAPPGAKPSVIASQPPPSGPQGAPSAQPPGGLPVPNSNCPAGLEYLSTLDTLIVDQKVEPLGATTGWESKNKYVVQDQEGQPIFYAAEESNVWLRRLWVGARPFMMKIADSRMQEVMRFKRELNCSSCLFPCSQQVLEVFSNGMKIGSVEQIWNILPSFKICDATGDTVLQIKGPFLTIAYCGSDVNFDVLSADGNYQAGRISKKWSGFVREYFTNADTFEITFDIDLDVKIKAVLLGACFLIDFMYFERAQLFCD